MMIRVIMVIIQLAIILISNNSDNKNNDAHDTVKSLCRSTSSEQTASELNQNSEIAIRLSYLSASKPSRNSEIAIQLSLLSARWRR